MALSVRKMEVFFRSDVLSWYACDVPLNFFPAVRCFPRLVLTQPFPVSVVGGGAFRALSVGRNYSAIQMMPACRPVIFSLR